LAGIRCEYEVFQADLESGLFRAGKVIGDRIEDNLLVVAISVEEVSL